MIKEHVTGFQHLGLPVTKIEQSVSFYERLGFSVIMSTTLPDRHRTDSGQDDEAGRLRAGVVPVGRR